jgi:hypothetical protein
MMLARERASIIGVIHRRGIIPALVLLALEALVANESPLRLTVRDVALRPALATAVVTTRRGTTVPVDLVRSHSGWLLSFSSGDDPLAALAGTT